MTTSTLATMEWAMWRMAASGDQALHFQPSTDEMAQLEENHVEAERYERTCYQTGDPFCLPSAIRVNGTEPSASRLLHKQTCPVNTQFHPGTIVHRNPIHPAFRGQTRSYEF